MKGEFIMDNMNVYETIVIFQPNETIAKEEIKNLLT